MEIQTGAPDKRVEQAQMGLSIKHGRVQIHEKWTRRGNLLKLVFTNNPSLISTGKAQCISDHDIAKCRIRKELFYTILDLYEIKQTRQHRSRNTKVKRGPEYANKEKTEILNNQFKSVFTEWDQNSQKPVLKKRIISILDITSEGIQKLLKNVNPSKAM